MTNQQGKVIGQINQLASKLRAVQVGVVVMFGDMPITRINTAAWQLGENGAVLNMAEVVAYFRDTMLSR